MILCSKQLRPMMFTGLVAVVAVACTTHAANLTVPVSNVNNDQIQFGLPGIAGVTGSAGLTGTLDLAIESNIDGVTTIQFLGGTVSIADTVIEQEVLFFGSVPAIMNVQFNGVSFDVLGGPYSVESPDLFPTEGLELKFNQGLLTLTITPELLDPVVIIADLATSPQSFFATGTLDSGPGQASLVGPDFNLFLPIVAVTPSIPVGDFDVSFAFIGELSGSAVVPELSSFWQSSALGLLLPIGYLAMRRRAKSLIAEES